MYSNLPRVTTKWQFLSNKFIIESSPQQETKARKCFHSICNWQIRRRTYV